MKTLICSCLLFVAAAVYGQPTYTLSGFVLNESNQPVAGATVHLLNTGWSTITGDKGDFVITGLPAGAYSVQVSAIGYATQGRSITLQQNEQVEIQLTPVATKLDAVLVSAQKKEDWMQYIPLSITALADRQVINYRLWNSRQLTAIAPNLYTADPGDMRSVTSVRGITSTSYDPAVATYIDGVNQFGLDTYISQLFDIERIEILRGPQGSLYGRNAMGGVINIITRAPGNKDQGMAEISIGNKGQQRYLAAYRTALIKDKLFAGIALLHESRKGFYTNDFNGDDFDRQSSQNGNYYLRYIFNKRWQVQLNVKHQLNRNDGTFPLTGDAETAFATPFHLNQNAITRMQDHSFNTSLTIQHTGPRFNFSSQTAWQSNYRYYEKPIDGDFSPLDAVTIINNYGSKWNNVKVWTQEFRFTSPVSTLWKDWTAGAYFFYQNSPVKQATYFGEDAYLVGAPDQHFSIINTSRGKSYGAAAYGQYTIKLVRNFDFSAGIRYDYEHKKQQVLSEYQKDPDPNPLFPIVPDTSATAAFSAFTPKLSITYDLPGQQHLYASYSRGYRVGGLTQLSSDPSQPPLYEYKPEYSNNWELGYKTEWGQQRYRLNVTAFYTIVTNAQVPTLVLPDAITITRNAGELESRGVEAELAALPFKGLEANWSFGYTRARYETLKLSRNGSEENLAGNRQVFTPEMTSMLALQYNYLLNQKNRLTLVLRGEWMYLGQQYFDLANEIRQSPYQLGHARFGVTSRHIDVMGWVRNVGDTRYIAFAYDFGAVHLGNPRTYGVTVTARL
jgi:Outer membrane receptor proteins, mostly Fe transport